MGRARRKDVREEQLTGLKYFDQLAPLFERLHESGCERDAAGNRVLHFDQYCLLVLLYLFNPVVTSLRSLQQASGLAKVQKKLRCARASLGSLSESSHVFDPELLQGVIQELGEQLQPIGAEARLASVRHTITLVDGTLLKALPRIAEAMWLTSPTGKVHRAWRLHTHFELLKGVPVRMDLSDGRNSGKSDEKNVLRSALEADRCYVMDRWYSQYRLLNDVAAAKSSYVCRVRDNTEFQLAEELPLPAEALGAGVLGDQIVTLGSGRRGAQTDHPLRLVLIRATPHQRRTHRNGKSGGASSDGVLRVVTNLMDVPAEVVALLYQRRYTIELFFRFFKHVLGCRHLLSDDPRGIAVQTYMAIIACMLISLLTGRKPSLRTYEMICYYFMGWASQEELLAHIANLKPHDAPL